MSYVIQLQADINASITCFELDEMGLPKNPQQLEWSVLAEHVQDAPVCALLPAAKSSVFFVPMPKMPKAELNQALPFAVEDLIASDLDDVVLAKGEYHNEMQTVAVVDKAYFKSVFNKLKSQRVYVTAITPFWSALPSESDCWTLAYHDQTVCCRLALQNGCAMSADVFAMLYPRMLNVHQAKLPNEIHHFGDALDKPDVPNFDVKWVEKGALVYDAKALFSGAVINFLQGRYRLKAKWSSHKKRWVQALSSVAFAIIVVFLLHLAQWGYNHHEINKARVEQQKIAEHLGVSLDASGQVRQELTQRIASLQSMHDDDGFLHILAHTAKIFHDHQEWHITSMAYQKNQLMVVLQGQAQTNVAPVLNAIRHAGYRVTTKKLFDKNHILRYQLNVERRS